MKKFKLLSIIVLVFAFFLVSDPKSKAADCFSFATESEWCILWESDGGIACSSYYTYNNYITGDGQHKLTQQYISCCGEYAFVNKAVQDYGCKPSGGPCVGIGGSCEQDSDCCYPFPENPGTCVAGVCEGN